jgi:hypothetical protein
LNIRTKTKTLIIYYGVRLYQNLDEFVVHMSVSKADILCHPGGVQYEYVTGPQSESGEDTPPGAEESGVFMVQPRAKRR